MNTEEQSFPKPTIARKESSFMIEIYHGLSTEEIFLFIVGVFIFWLPYLSRFKLVFVAVIILLYWMRLREIELSIHQKEQEIYNVPHNNHTGLESQGFLDRLTERDRIPLKYELAQLEHKRKFLADKFVIINLILLTLIELFINTRIT